MKNLKLSIFKIDAFLLFSSILLTILSQHPVLLENGSGRFLQLIWILPVIRLIILKRIKLDKVIKTPLIIYLIWFVFLVLADGITGNRYIDTPNFINLTMMFVMLLIGYYSASILKLEDFTKLLFWSSLLGGGILGLSVYIYAFSEGFDILSRVHTYGAKNSVSQILFSCFVFVFLLPSKLKFRIIKYLILLFMVYIILLLRSRATIIGFLALFYVLIIKSKNRNLQIFSVLLIIVGVIIVLYSDSLSKIFIDGILAGGKDINNLDDVSSERMSMLFSFPKLFQENMFFGRGYFYLESFPLATLVQVGIVGSVIIFSFIFWIFRMIKLNFSIFYSLDLSLIILFWVYMLNALLEEQSPFGPGAKSFLFWLPFGFVLYKRAFFKGK